LVFSKIGVGPQHDGVVGVGQIHQDVVAHAVAATEPDVFGININSSFKHDFTEIGWGFYG
jgi:hypothetical protein